MMFHKEENNNDNFTWCDENTNQSKLDQICETTKGITKTTEKNLDT